jgi:hypothetical protein
VEKERARAATEDIYPQLARLSGGAPIIKDKLPLIYHWHSHEHGVVHDNVKVQVKEARPSVLEAYAGASAFPNHGQRVVNGYRLLQTASDIFLGWTESANRRHHFFVRQLRDIKIKPVIESLGKPAMTIFAEWCGHSLALSHARSGDPAAISGYLGKSDAFDQAVATFATAYADQTEKDHAAVKRAIRTGKLEAAFEEQD